MQLPCIPIDDWLVHLSDSSDEDLASLARACPGPVWDGLWSLRVAAGYEPLPVHDGALERLHARLKGRAFESDLWSELLAKGGFRLPEKIAHDLIDRRIAVGEVFRATPTMNVLRRVSKDDSQAAWRMGCTLCFSTHRTVAEFAAFLRDHTHHLEMLRSFTRLESLSPAKEEALLDFFRSHPHGAELLQSRRMKVAAASAAESRDVEELKNLRTSRDPHVLRELAANPRTPIPILKELALQSGTKFARQIRVLAAQNLSQRQDNPDEEGG
jgi:hypothetical protein